MRKMAKERRRRKWCGKLDRRGQSAERRCAFSDGARGPQPIVGNSLVHTRCGTWNSRRAQMADRRWGCSDSGQLNHRDAETLRSTAQARSARPQPKIALGPLAPRRDAPPLRANVRGARGCKGSGVRGSLSWDCEFSGAIATPLFAAISSARCWSGRRGGGPAALPFVGRKSSRGAKKLRVSRQSRGFCVCS